MTSSSYNLIKAQAYTNDPDKAWSHVKDSITKIPIQPMSLDTPIFPNKVLFRFLTCKHFQKVKLSLKKKKPIHF